MTDFIDPRKLTFILCFLLFFPGMDGRSIRSAAGVSAADGPVHAELHGELPAERIFLHTDREVYVAGETLLFKAYLLQSGHGYPSGGIAYLTLRSRHGTVAGIAMPLQGRVSDGNIYLEDTLSTGWYELVAFTNQMRAAGEPIYFRKTLFIANRFDQDLTIPDAPGNALSVPGAGMSAAGTEKSDNKPLHANGAQHADGKPLPSDGKPLRLEMAEKYGTREAVPMQLSLDGGPDAFALLSVSVSPVLACNEAGQRPAEYAAMQAMGPSQGTAGPDRRAADPSDYAETNAWLLQGRVTDPQTGKGVAGARVVLNTPGTGVTFLHAQSDAEGRFRISLPFYYNGRELYLSAFPETGQERLAIEVDDKFAFDKGFYPVSIPGMEARKAFISRSQDLLSARKAFQSEYFRRTGRAVLTASPPSFLFAQPRLTVIPAQYTPFDDLQEIAREIVLPWRIRRSDDTYRSQLHCADTGSPLPETPMYFVDGILVHDLGRLIPLGSRHIDRILVHNTQWAYNGLTFYGAVNIVTRGDEYLQLIPMEEYVKTHFELYLKDRSFNPPAYPNGNSVNREEPDLRSTLYWNPDIRISRGGGTDLRFFTGDVPGEYLVRVEGVTSGGERISLSKKFLVEL